MSLFRKTRTATEPAPTPGGISLTKGGTGRINLNKADQTAFVTAHLDWNGGNTDRRAKGADLELYVLYVPADEITALTRHDGHAVYYRNLGNTLRPPYIKHHGDSLAPGRETVTISRLDQQGYALVCAYSARENGVGSFKSYGAHAVVTDGAGQTVTVPLYDDNPRAYWVAIALIDFTGNSVTIRQVETYSAPNSENRPVLYSDGMFAMDAGPVEFKGH